MLIDAPPATEFSVAMPASVHQEAVAHLLGFYRQGEYQENLCFALWRPSKGSRRLTALVYKLILPTAGETLLAGNVSFTSSYLERAGDEARQNDSGLLLMHNHLGPGWQAMSLDDVQAEEGRAAFALTATDLPLVGLTLGTDENWSARFWPRIGSKRYACRWCQNVRVVGQRLACTFHPQLAPEAAPRDELLRTINVWGAKNQANLARIHVGVVGVGSVGRLVVECLARIGVRRITVIDFDHINRVNLDRQVGAFPQDVVKKRLKVDLAKEGFLAASTASHPEVEAVAAAVTEPEGFAAALNCDAIFCCVDRPWGRHVLNHIAYAYLIPVTEGGIRVRTRQGVFRGADWSCRTVGPHRCCLSCAGAYDVGQVDEERRGLLDDPSYIDGLPKNIRAEASQNVLPFSMSLASHQVLQYCALVTGLLDRYDLGEQRFHYNLGEIEVSEPSCRVECEFSALTATGDTVYPMPALTARRSIPINNP